jgi:hypothetical protein
MLEQGRIQYIQFEYGERYLEANTTISEVYNYLTYYGYVVARMENFGLDIVTGKNIGRFENYRWGNFFAAVGSFL